jgi:imidazolonepropionase
MTPDEAIWSATAGGAQALRRTDIGRLTPGTRADLALLDAPSHVHLAYRPGVPLVSTVWHRGTQIPTAWPASPGAVRECGRSAVVERRRK